MFSRGKTAAPTTPVLSRTTTHSRSSFYHAHYSQISIPGPFARSLSTTSTQLLVNVPIILSIFLTILMIEEYGELLFDEPIPTGPPSLLPLNISRLLGPYSPYYPVQEYKKVEGCNVTQVHFLQRHSARFPTKRHEAKIKRALSHIKPPPKEMKNSSLGFMRKYRYDLKTDSLLWFGAEEARAAGIQAYNRYSHLARQSPPFLRASKSIRVVETAKYWKEGFESAGRMKLGKPLVLPGGKEFNNTLENGSCPAHSNKLAHDAQATYLTFFSPITTRLNADSPGSNLTNEDIPPLMSLCSFESLYKYKTSTWCGVFKNQPVSVDEGRSEEKNVKGEWVGLGDGSGGEWEMFEYLNDLEKFYNTGPGNPNGRPQGIGYINELIARLTNSPVNDTTQTNRTLDCNVPLPNSASTALSSPSSSSDSITTNGTHSCNTSFPLNWTVYADFTHGNEMTAILAALGVLREVGADPAQSQLRDPIYGQFQDQPGQETFCQEMVSGVEYAPRSREMDPSHPDPHRKWVASKIVPFAGRLVVERLSCPNPSSRSNSGAFLTSKDIPDRLELDERAGIPNEVNEQDADSTTVEAVRLLLNDAVLHIPGCTEELGSGVCTMPKFLRSQRYSRAMGEGEWERCFEGL